mgnify:CR=1 FL=1
MARGRKSKVDIVRENIEQIKQWKKTGATDEQIFKALGVSKACWYKYLAENKDLQEALKESVQCFVQDLRGELARQAFKHTLETKKQYVKVDQETGHKTQYTEITSKEVDGSISAIHLLLKNLDRENWKEDWNTYEFKKQELEIRKQLADANAF